MLMNHAGAAAQRHRSQPQMQPQPTGDARTELQLFFKSYDSAMLDFDADQLAGQFDLPCLLSAPEGSGSFSARGELRAALARNFLEYRHQGLVSASLAALSLTALSHDFARAEAVWSFCNGRGQEMRNIACAYTLRRSPPGQIGRWRIVHAVSLDAPMRNRPRGETLSLR